MMSHSAYDVAVIGGGIVGIATAYSLLQKAHRSVIVLEAEDRLAAHQSGHNSGVIHSGLYYRPGSLKAANCIKGREMMVDFCRRYDIPHEQCGKLVVATTERELPMLRALEERGRANGLVGIVRLRREEIRQHEPNAAGVGALFVPQTGIVDYTNVVEVMARLIRERGGEIVTSARFHGAVKDGRASVLRTDRGDVRASVVVNCGGLRCDEIARRCGIDPEIRIIPFRGEYYHLVPERRNLVRNLLYPVPDPRYPFLGVHFTRTIDGTVEAGPNAVLAFKKEGYAKSDISWKDLRSMFGYSGFWKMARRHYRTAAMEWRRSYSKQRFVRSLQQLIPSIQDEDIIPGGAGVRAQALDRNGNLLDDFFIKETPGMVHVLNAPSPAATSSLSIGETIASIVQKHLDV